MDHIGKVEELRREEGMREAISELKTLMRKQRIGKNSSDLTKLPGSIDGGITQTLHGGRKGKSPVDLKVAKIKKRYVISLYR